MRKKARKATLSKHMTVRARILEAVREAPGRYLDDLELRVPDLTWNQVFLKSIA